MSNKLIVWAVVIKTL